MLFCCFEAFWGKFTKNSLLVKKVTISERSTEILRKFVFLNKFEKDQIKEENLDLFKQLFLIKPVKGENINKNCFSPQNEPHTAKRCFSVVLKHFWGNSLKNSLFIQKSGLSQKEAQKHSERLLFSTSLKRRKSRGKFGFGVNKCFVQTSKRGKY